MPHRLPPDLDRVGEHLTAAASRAVDARRERSALRRRLAIAGSIGALAFAAITPAAVGPAERVRGPFELLVAGVPASDPGLPRVCDQPRALELSQTACPAVASAETAIALHRARRW